MPLNHSEKISTTKRIAVIPGDGIGPEVTREAVKVLKAATSGRGSPLEFTESDWGAERYLRDGTTLPAEAVAMLRREYDAILFGAVGDPRVPSNKHAADILLGLRAKLDLYVNLRPAQLLDAALTPLRDRGTKDVNFVVLRENTEGLYAGIGLGRVCMSDKSNVLTFGHDLWQRVFSQVKNEYSDIESRHLYIDTLVMEVVRDPGQFRVIVTCNLFGDILSDLAAQLAGGLGLAPSGNIHPGKISLFEPVHGSAPTIAGKNLANPAGAVLSSALMLDHLGLASQADAVRKAVRTAVREKHTTIDLGGTLGTREAGDWLAEYITKNPA